MTAEDRLIRGVLRRDRTLVADALVCGASPNTPIGSRSGTVLHRAAADGAAKIVARLLDDGADVHAHDGDQATPLHAAAAMGSEETALLLLEKGANINAATARQNTPLHRAAFHGRTNLVRLLLERGADAIAKNVDGITPLHLAVSNRHIETSRLLVTSGADIHARANDGQTPLAAARASKSDGHGCNELIALLDAEASRLEASAQEPAPKRVRSGGRKPRSR